VLALTLLLIALRKFKRIKPPEKSIASAKQTASVLSRAKPHPRKGAGSAAGANGSSLDKRQERTPAA
jgi:hypothetical protein